MEFKEIHPNIKAKLAASHGKIKALAARCDGACRRSKFRRGLSLVHIGYFGSAAMLGHGLYSIFGGVLAFGGLIAFFYLKEDDV